MYPILERQTGWSPILAGYGRSLCLPKCCYLYSLEFRLDINSFLSSAAVLT